MRGAGGTSTTVCRSLWYELRVGDDAIQSLVLGYIIPYRPFRRHKWIKLRSPAFRYIRWHAPGIMACKNTLGPLRVMESGTNLYVRGGGH